MGKGYSVPPDFSWIKNYKLITATAEAAGKLINSKNMKLHVCSYRPEAHMKRDNNNRKEKRR